MQIITFTSFVAMSLPSPVLAPIFVSHTDYTFLGFNFSSQTAASLAYGAYPFGVFLGGSLLGILSDKLNPMKIFLFTLASAASLQLISGYCVLTEQFSLLIGLRLLTGLFEGNIVIARTIVAKLCPLEKDRCAALGKLNAALTIGWIIGPLLGALLTFGANGKYLPFFASSVICILTLLLVAFYFNTEYIDSISKNNIIEKTLKSQSGSFIISLAAASFVLTMGIDCFYQFFPIYLAGFFAAEPSKIATAMVITGIFGSATNYFLTPRIAKAYKPLTVIMVGAIVLTVCLLVIAQSMFYIPVYALLPIIGCCIAVTHTTLSTSISMATPFSSQGKLMGLLLGSRSFGAALVCFSLAPLINYSYKVPFFVAALFIMAGLFAIRKLLLLGATRVSQEHGVVFEANDI